MRALRKHKAKQPCDCGDPDFASLRIFHAASGYFQTRLMPGETYATGNPREVIVTVLGSCVSACIRYPVTGWGGMNHFMLPESETGVWGDCTCSALRYGNFAMEALINEVLHSGCTRERLEIKLFGGANFGGSKVGTTNSDFALRYLANEGLRVIAADLGGLHGRRIHYHPASGKVARLLLLGIAERRAIDDERLYGRALRAQPPEGSIELFE